MTITDHGRSDGTAIDTPIAGRREWIGLMVLGLANLLYVMDLTVLKLAVPAISVGLQPSSTQLLLELFWWGSVFLVALPVAALLLVLGPRVLPEERDVEAGRLDLPSATMPVVAVLATIYGLKQVVQDGLDLLPAGCIVAGLAVGGGFVRRQRTLADPVIDVGLFRITTFSAAPAVNFLAIFVIVGSQLGPRLAGRVRPANTIAAGLALGAVGLVMLTQLGAADGLALLVIGSLIISLGFAPVFGFATELVVGSAPPQRAGAASAINETAVKLGGALGIAVLGSIGVAIYRTELADRLPAAVPAEAAAAARDTLGGAVAVAAVVTLGGQAAASADLHAEAEVARATTTPCGQLEAATR